MSKIKDYINDFIHDETGTEMMEWTVIVVIAVTMISVVTGVAMTIRSSISRANEIANNEFGNLLDGAGGSK